MLIIKGRNDMEIIEKHILGKNKDQSKCEDIIFHNEHFVAIIDGATSKSDYSFNGNSTGKQAALLVEEALSLLTGKEDKKETADFITQHIYNFYIQNDHLKRIEEEARNKCTASVIIYSVFHSEIWQFGDCHCLIDNEYHNADKLIDFVTHSNRSIMVGALLEKGYTVEELLTNDLSREAIVPILNHQQYYQNIPNSESIYGYVCFDGFKIPVEDVPAIKVPKEATQIVLASDGYPKLFNTLEESENYLSHVKENDPLCYKIYPSTKGFNFDLNSYDDRSYISVKLK
jgi:glycerophosphoryl diester phosphodiesterase